MDSFAAFVVKFIVVSGGVVVDSDGVVFVAGVVSGVHVFEASVC